MLALTILALQAATPDAAQDPIVVTARRLADAEAALAACIRRQCPPDEDMVASLRQTDAQFLAGRYREARETLSAARRRNKPYAKRFPVLTSELWRADAQLASLSGERVSAQISARSATDALRGGLAKDDPRILIQRLDVGNAVAMGAEPDKAIAIYADVAARARAIGNREVEGRALLRTAVVQAAMARRDRNYIAVARRSLDGIARTTDAPFAPFREAAAVVRAKLEAFLGKEPPAAVTAAMPASAAAPVLLFAPPISLGLPGRCGADRGSAQFDLSLECREPIPIDYDLTRQWANVRYDVLPDGQVVNVAVVERGDKSVDAWVGNVVKAVAKRRYTPFATIDGKPFARLERYSLVADYAAQTGGRVRMRALAPHVEMTDLTGFDLAIRR